MLKFPKGDIEDSVLATGVWATKMVSVGAQVSGQVKKDVCSIGAIKVKQRAS